jgi:carboxyl-terminal processing protease
MKDKSEYYSELDSSKVHEGDNLNHTAEQDSSRPEYKTSKGRIVFGGGGITPDYIVKSEYMTDYTRNLLRKNLFYTFILSYLDRNSESIKLKYKDDLNLFRKYFFISDDILNEFIGYAKSKEVDLNKDDLKKDNIYIRTRLKAQIARNFWKNEGWYSVLLSTDDQFNKALTLFDEAKALENLK